MSTKKKQSIKKRSLEAQSLWRPETNFKPKIVPSKKIYNRKNNQNKLVLDQ